MELSNEFDVRAPIDQAWAVLTDLELIAPCLPGAQLQEVDGDEYRGTQNDEVRLATKTARHLGTIHATRWIGRNDFELEIERLLAAMDQPSIDGVNTYFVSKVAAKWIADHESIWKAWLG